MTNKIYKLENFNAVRIIYDSGCIPALAVNLDKNSSHYGWLCSAGSDGKWISICDIRNILVEVTPADFDTKQLADELIRRISCGEYIDLLSKGVPVKEKTLADLTMMNLYLNSIIGRCYVIQNLKFTRTNYTKPVNAMLRRNGLA